MFIQEYNLLSYTDFTGSIYVTVFILVNVFFKKLLLAMQK
jgi:hypothetical protein